MSLDPKKLKAIAIVLIGCFICFGIFRCYSFRIITIDVSAKSSCIALMKQIEGAKGSWALEHNKKTNDIPTWNDLVGRDLYLRDILRRPNGGTYTIGRMDETVSCSIPHEMEY